MPIPVRPRHGSSDIGGWGQARASCAGRVPAHKQVRAGQGWSEGVPADAVLLPHLQGHGGAGRGRSGGTRLSAAWLTACTAQQRQGVLRDRGQSTGAWLSAARREACTHSPRAGALNAQGLRPRGGAPHRGARSPRCPAPPTAHGSSIFTHPPPPPASTHPCGTSWIRPPCPSPCPTRGTSPLPACAAAAAGRWRGRWTRAARPAWSAGAARGRSAPQTGTPSCRAAQDAAGNVRQWRRCQRQAGCSEHVGACPGAQAASSVGGCGERHDAQLSLGQLPSPAGCQAPRKLPPLSSIVIHSPTGKARPQPPLTCSPSRQLKLLSNQHRSHEAHASVDFVPPTHLWYSSSPICCVMSAMSAAL